MTREMIGPEFLADSDVAKPNHTVITRVSAAKTGFFKLATLTAKTLVKTRIMISPDFRADADVAKRYHTSNETPF